MCLPSILFLLILKFMVLQWKDVQQNVIIGSTCWEITNQNKKNPEQTTKTTNLFISDET